jgi:hypothetical protein
LTAGGERVGSGAPPKTIVVFEASGDLMRRKLIPALYNLHRKGRLPTGTYCRTLTAHRLLILSAAAPPGFLMQRGGTCP